MKAEKNYTLYGLMALCVLLICASAYLFYELYNYKKSLANQVQNNSELNEKMASTTNALFLARADIEQLNQELEQTKDELDDTEDNLRDEKNRNEDFADQIDDLTGTVKTLDKLSKTDQELLQKYSKVYFLNENYVPSDIKQIDNDYVLAGKDAQFFHGDAMPFLERMLDRAERDGIDLKVTSAYRSFDHQQQLKGEYTQIYGSGANTFSADQGYSEHQLGTTLDLTIPSVGGAYDSFANTEAYQWLLKNAYKYGFTLSYPEGNSFYVFEPWHWRFVGEDLAEDLYDDDAHFYDWDQRKIDSYLIKIFD